jgi:hypothetical protein
VLQVRQERVEEQDILEHKVLKDQEVPQDQQELKVY